MEKTSIKVATLNLCLGLKYKKEVLNRMIIENKIDILCFQEAEIESDFNNDLLNIPGYCLELERNTMKARTGIYMFILLNHDNDGLIRPKITH